MAVASSDVAAQTLAVAIGVLIVDGALVMVHLRERSRRPVDLDDADRRYYRGRDLRRGLGAVLMAAAAALMITSARLKTEGDLGASRLYVGLWVTVIALIAVLLALAMLDWVANRRYAARHRNALAQEREALIAEAAQEARRRRGRRRHQGRGPTDPSMN